VGLAGAGATVPVGPPSAVPPVDVSLDGLGHGDRVNPETAEEVAGWGVDAGSAATPWLQPARPTHASAKVAATMLRDSSGLVMVRSLAVHSA
jgi:hypothetical protein